MNNKDMPDGCPYCGQKPSFGLTQKRGCQMHGDPMQFVTLKCNNAKCPAQPQIKGGDIYLCGETSDGLAKGKRLAREEAIRIWNTRADLSPAPKAETPTPPNAALDAFEKQLCGDDLNGGFIRSIAFTVWDLCHNPKHEDGNTDWANDTLPTVQQAVAIVRKKIAALRNTETKG